MCNYSYFAEHFIDEFKIEIRAAGRGAASSLFFLP